MRERVRDKQKTNNARETVGKREREGERERKREREREREKTKTHRNGDREQERKRERVFEELIMDIKSSNGEQWTDRVYHQPDHPW